MIPRLTQILREFTFQDAHSCQRCKTSIASRVVRLGAVNYYLCTGCAERVR